MGGGQFLLEFVTNPGQERSYLIPEDLTELFLLVIRPGVSPFPVTDTKSGVKLLLTTTNLLLAPMQEPAAKANPLALKEIAEEALALFVFQILEQAIFTVAAEGIVFRGTEGHIGEFTVLPFDFGEALGVTKIIGAKAVDGFLDFVSVG